MRLLLVEDNQILGRSLTKGLADVGHSVEWVQDGETALAAHDSNKFDLTILDINLPTISGLNVLKQLRMNPKNDHPVIMLTAMDSTTYKVKGLNTGADDYLTKPFDFEELVARIGALTRRKQNRQDAFLRCGAVVLDMEAKTVTKNNENVILTAKELRICSLLMERRNRIVSKTDLEESLYGWAEDIDSNTVEVAIYNLRKKLGKDFIKTFRGIGYTVRA